MTDQNHAWAWSTAALLALNVAVLAVASDGPLARSHRAGGKTGKPAATTAAAGTGTGGSGGDCACGPGGRAAGAAPS